MKKIIILMMLIGTYAGAQELRNDKVLNMGVISATIHFEYNWELDDNVYVVNVRYLKSKYSRHEFKTKKERRAFMKMIRNHQVSIDTIIKNRKN